jgi:phage/plasmid-associated DNA primase
MTTETMDNDNIVKLAAYQELAKNEDPVTEDAAALAFTERYRDALRFDHDIGKWLVWTGTHWQRECTGLAFSWARELARDLARAQPNKVRLISSKANFAGNVEGFARTDRTFAVTSDVWDLNRYLLGTPGGTVDLLTGEIRKAVPEDFITKMTAVVPADKPECPRWLRFLREATNDDQDLIAFLQQFAGYMLTGDTKEHLAAVHPRGRRQRQERVSEHLQRHPRRLCKDRRHGDLHHVFHGQASDRPCHAARRQTGHR